MAWGAPHRLRRPNVAAAAAATLLAVAGAAVEATAGADSLHPRLAAAVPALFPALTPSARVTARNTGVCGPPQEVATATCPCYFGFATVADEADQVFDVTLSLAVVQPQPLSATDAAAAARWLDSLSAVDLSGSLLPPGSQLPGRYVAEWPNVVVDMAVAVTLSVSVRGGGGMGGGDGCTATLAYAFEAV